MEEFKYPLRKRWTGHGNVVVDFIDLKAGHVVSNVGSDEDGKQPGDFRDDWIAHTGPHWETVEVPRLSWEVKMK